MSITICCTFRDEVNALPGFLEMASQFADEIFLADCSMDMSPSTDGSLDIIRKWRLPDPPLWNLSNGFGAVRSQLLNSCKTDWAILMDCDERIGVTVPVLRCEGTDRYPAIANPNLRVIATGEIYDQRKLLKEKMADADQHGFKAIRFQRRHWFSFDFKRPCENWNIVKDYQLRCMRPNKNMGFTLEPKMHERAWDFTKHIPPEYVEDDDLKGPFLDHFHCHFKPMEPEQRAADIRAYDKLDGR